MNFEHVSLAECTNLTGTVVVIDVLRAFSTAAYAFAAGVERILPVSSIEEAFALKEQHPSALLVGEVRGLPIPGFDFNNSPTVILKQDLAGKQLIQRTTAGTQGVVRSQTADLLLTGSFCCAAATARYIRKYSGQDALVTFVVTGESEDGSGDEDAACADYIESLLKGETPDPGPYLQRVWASRAAEKFLDEHVPEFLESDLEYCTALDRFDFAMRVEKQDGLLVMKPVVL